MARTKTTIESFVSPEEFREAVLDFEAYPKFLSEVTRVEVHEKKDDHARVTFHIKIAFMGFKADTQYTLDYAIDGNTIRWTLAESPDVTKNEGAWRLEETSDGETLAHYEAELTTSLPIPPEVQEAFAEQELPKMMEKFRDWAEG